MEGEVEVKVKAAIIKQIEVATTIYIETDGGGGGGVYTDY